MRCFVGAVVRDSAARRSQLFLAGVSVNSVNIDCHILMSLSETRVILSIMLLNKQLLYRD